MKLIIDIPKDAYEKAKTMGEAFGFPSPIVKAVAHGTPIIEARQETLEQEPCEDCISREWLKIAIHNFYYGLKHTPTEEDIQAYIDAAPPVTPQPKTGHWIEHKHNGIAHIECSECLSWFLRSHLLRNSYCPNCGSKMEG